MAEVVLAVVAKLANYFVDPTLLQVQYLFCIGKITRDVETIKEELIYKQGRVQERIEEAINKTERIDDEVNKWKNEVQSLIVEVGNLEQALRANTGCFRWLPTWRRYCLCKKLAKRTQRMIELNIKSDQLEPFSHLVPVTVPDIKYHPSNNLMYFESTKKAFDQLWEALQDDSSFIIGLFGMRGSGKTTLVKKVEEKAKELNSFDRVVFTTISQTPNIKKIQGKIGNFLGLKLDEEFENRRARKIALRLQSAEQILIILDDVWEMLNLEDIGIPFKGNHQRNCKVLLTTHCHEVCTLMDCQKKIPLHLLTEEEAWILFQNNAGVDEGAEEVMAREIAKECKGLPVAIEAMGKCLKGKGLDEMHVMLHKLRHSKPINMDEGVRDAFACLKLSYDYLRTPDAKSLFLLCAMFSENHVIIIEDILKYGIGLGLCRDADSLEIARSQLRVNVNILIESSLLMYSKNSFGLEWLTMHDMVRDVALWIASKEDRCIMVDHKGINELLKDEAIRGYWAVSSWYRKTELCMYPCQLDAPKLEILLLNSIKPLNLSYASFKLIKGLKVIAVIKEGASSSLLGSLPQSISWLSNLRTLQLQGWKLEDISYVERLTRLEILDLQGSEFQNVPNGIEKLNKLKLIDLSRCITVECCYKVIGRCSQLEELYVSSYDHLESVNCCECLMDVAAFPKLRRYRLKMGQYKDSSLFGKVSTRALYMGELNISTSNAIIKDLALRADTIEFYKLQGGYKSFIPDVVRAIGSMNELRRLSLCCCLEIKCLANEIAPHEDAIIPNLVELKLHDMVKLEQLCHGPPLLSLFKNLESLCITNSPMLTSLFHVSVTCTFLSLIHLSIRECYALKHVINEESGDDAGEERSMYDQNETLTMFPLLNYLELHNLPNLLRICSKSCHPRWPSMKKVNWTNCPKLSTSCDSFMVGSKLRQPHPNMELQAVNGHQPMKEGSNPLATVSHIESIFLGNCVVEYIFQYQAKVEVQNHTISNGFNLLKQIPRFRYLKYLKVYDCAKLKFVFCFGICPNLSELISMTISNCEELEEIFMENEENQSNVSKAKASLPKLQSLTIKRCNKLRIIFSMMSTVATSILPQLRTLSISNAAQLEEIFRLTDTECDANDNEKEIMFPNLKDITLKKLPRLVNVCHGFKLHVAEFCTMLVHECPKLLPILGANGHWSRERIVRKFVLKCSQLSNSGVFTLPLSVLNTEELSRVHDMFRVIGEYRQASKDTEILGSKHQILNGLTPTQVLSFQYLHTLEVIRCEKLKFLFSVSTILHNSLPKLNFLTLSDCEELEEIIAHNEEPQNTSDAQVCFPKLRVLEIKECNKLKRLFSSTLVTVLPQLNSLRIIRAAQLEEIFGHKREGKEEQHFPELAELVVHRCSKLKCVFFSLPTNGDLAQLQYLEIIGCSQLEQVFSCELEIHDGALNKNVLPKLKRLKLEALPNLTDICAGFPFQMQFESLLSYVVEDCPTFSKPTLAALENFLPRHQGNPADHYQESEDIYDLDYDYEGIYAFNHSDVYNTAPGFLYLTKKKHKNF